METNSRSIEKSGKRREAGNKCYSEGRSGQGKSPEIKVLHTSLAGKEIKSVANVSRSDVNEFLSLAAEIPIKPEVQEFALKEANKALVELKEGKIRGAKVLRID